MGERLTFKNWTHPLYGEAESVRGEWDVGRLAEAAHYAMCDVSHHDSHTVCKNQRRYELIAQSMYTRLTAATPSKKGQP